MDHDSYEAQVQESDGWITYFKSGSHEESYRALRVILDNFSYIRAGRILENGRVLIEIFPEGYVYPDEKKKDWKKEGF